MPSLIVFGKVTAGVDSLRSAAHSRFAPKSRTDSPRSFLIFARRLLCQSQKNYRHKGHSVRGPQKCCAHSEKLSLCSCRDYVAVTDGRERHNLIVKIIN